MTPIASTAPDRCLNCAEPLAVAGTAVLVYALLSVMRVYQESWLRALLKSSGIAGLYVLSSIPAFMLIIAWATLSS
jgi:hypothetical protein